MTTRHMLSRCWMLGAGLLISTAAAAQAPQASSAGSTVRAATKDPATKETPSTAAPAHPKRWAAAHGRHRAKHDDAIGSGPIATLPGFQMLEHGASRVSVEVSRKVAVTEQKGPGRVIYRLAGVRVPGRLARMPLPTGFFPTPVGRIELIEHDDAADLIIETREATQPTFTIVETPRGMVLHVDFPQAVSPALRERTAEDPDGPAAAPVPPNRRSVGTKRIEALPERKRDNDPDLTN